GHVHPHEQWIAVSLETFHGVADALEVIGRPGRQTGRRARDPERKRPKRELAGHHHHTLRLLCGRLLKPVRGRADSGGSGSRDRHGPPLTPVAALPSSPIAVHRGRFTEADATRLLWRAGFGPQPGEAKTLAKLGLDGAVRSLTRPHGAAQLIG